MWRTSAREVRSCEVRRAVSEPSLAELVIRARGGDRDAFAVVYQRFAGAVHAVVLARVRWGEATDVVQDVFLAAWERLPAVRDPAAFPGWLMTIARHRAIDAVRRVRPAQDLIELGADAPPSAEAREALEAIRALPEAYRELLLMRLVEGMSGPEIAERTGLQPGSVRVNLHRGMKMLRERLGVTDVAEVGEGPTSESRRAGARLGEEVGHDE
jgi:RNA polymerase sigma-70 factor (ECF subfamily)